MGAVVEETAAVAAKAAVAGAWVADDYATAGAATKAAAAATIYDGSSTKFAAPTQAGASTQAQLAALTVTRDKIVALQAIQAAGQLASVDAVNAASTPVTTARTAAQLAADLEAVDAAIAAASGTAAVAAVAAKSTTSTYSRLQFNINGSTVADNGMEFGGKMRIQTTGATSPAAGPQVYLKMGDVAVYGGNIPGPLDTMPNVYGYTVGFSGGTFQGLATSGDKLGYSSAGNGAGAMQVDYSNGNVTVKAAHQPGTDINQAMISYSMNGLTVAAGGQFSKKQAEDLSVVSLGYTFGDVSFALASGELDKTRKTTLSASGSIGNGVSLQGYIVEKEKEKNNGWGLGISYDLGGGAKFAAGYETKHDKTNRAEAGFHFTF